MFNKKIRKEKFVQYSGDVNLKKIPLLKEKHYYPIDIPLDGDAPKEYIKAYFYYDNCPKKANYKDWHGFFAKFGKKSYPHESIIEYLINKIGEYLGLNMNKTRLVQMTNGQIRFLSQDFREKNQRLIHGIEILGEYFEDENFIKEINQDRKNRRQLLTFSVIENAISHVYSSNYGNILVELIKLITFDAIVGNNDRHFSNWGVIYKIQEDDNTLPVLSPIYDTARALLWNNTEEAILKMYNQYSNGSNQLDDYINRSKPRFSFDKNPNANHFELIEYLVNYKESYKSVILPLIATEMEELVIEKLKIEMNCFFSKERCILVEAILRKRFQKLRKLTT